MNRATVRVEVRDRPRVHPAPPPARVPAVRPIPGLRRDRRAVGADRGPLAGAGQSTDSDAPAAAAALVCGLRRPVDRLRARAAPAPRRSLARIPRAKGANRWVRTSYAPWWAL